MGDRAPRPGRDPGFARSHDIARRLVDGLAAVIRGKTEVLEHLVTGILAGGHVLIEDVPGLGKTTLAKTVARLISRSQKGGAVVFRRIQFTPDLLPYDITGVDVFDPGERAFVFSPGPVFANILLADEINRTTPKVQSALLEVMAEGQVTVGNTTYRMDPFFFVIATQNPVEIEGVYPLPLAQIDRFLMRLRVGYPDRAVEEGIVRDDPAATVLPDRLARVRQGRHPGGTGSGEGRLLRRRPGAGSRRGLDRHPQAPGRGAGLLAAGKPDARARRAGTGPAAGQAVRDRPGPRGAGPPGDRAPPAHEGRAGRARGDGPGAGAGGALAHPLLMRRFARRLRAIIPLTLRGLLLEAAAAAAFAEGVLRADLAGLFWGAGFLLVPLYFLVAGHLLRAAMRRRSRGRPGFIQASLPAVVPSPGEEAWAHARVELPRWFAPGLTVRLLLPLSWHERRMDGVQARLEPGRNEKQVLFRPARRGTYRATEAVLETGDVLGFTANRLAVPLEEALAVLPAVVGREAPRRTAAQGGDSAARQRRRRRSEELLEARKYVPGDDPRRLNWKVFAHLDQLFLRIGEETPPPDSRMLFILDTAKSPLVPNRAADDCLDRLVESCASAACALLARRFALSLACPGVAGCPSFTQESRGQLLLALADVPWAGAGWKPEYPAGRAVRTAVVFSTAGSPALRGIMSAVTARGWSASLFLQGLPAEAAPRPLTLRRLLLRDPAERGPRGSAVTRRQAAALARALADELAEYRSPAWKVSHAQQA